MSEPVHTFLLAFVQTMPFGGGLEQGEMQREEAVCDVTGVISWGAVWTDTVLLPHCQADLLWGLRVGDTGRHSPCETVIGFIVNCFVFPRMRNNLF